MRLTIRERLSRSLDEALGRLRPPRPATAPCGGPCGCEEVAAGPAVHLGRRRVVQVPQPLTADDAALLVDNIKASGILHDPAGWVTLAEVDVRLLTSREVAALLEWDR